VTETPLDRRSGFFIATKPEKEGGLQHMTQGASKARGTVKWFSNEGDHGFVCPDDEGQDIHVRREHIVGDGAELLEKGDRVTYDMSEDAKGLWARNVTREEQRCYSWRDDCLERHEGKEARHEYYARLDEGEGV
jgi:CspA family cold shock protein